MVVEIDFENYSVEADRASEIRQIVSALREGGPVGIADLKQLVNELGVAEEDPNSAEPALPGFSALTNSSGKVYRPPEGHPAFGLRLTLMGTDLKLFYEQTSLLEITLLPKGNEFAVFFLNEAEKPRLDELLTGLALEIKRAKSAKSERQAAFRAKIGVGGKSSEASDVPEAAEATAVTSAEATEGAVAIAEAAAEAAGAPLADEQNTAPTEPGAAETSS